MPDSEMEKCVVKHAEKWSHETRCTVLMMLAEMQVVCTRAGLNVHEKTFAELAHTIGKTF